jgi:hypothetical protein
MPEDFTLDDILHPHRSTFKTWQDLQPGDWRRAVGDAAGSAWEAHPAHQRQHQKLQALIAQVRAHDIELSLRLEDEAFHLAIVALNIGSVLGYALAKTWPDGIHGLDGWIDRASAFADLDTLEQDS